MDNILEFIFQYRESIFLVILSIFLGIEVISHVPAVLHTPLMSGANAIHGVVIIGAIIVMGHASTPLSLVLGFLAVVLGT
ncbi:MAG TPA: proton-translocating transhydrogenase family protein, partial [Bacteroidales bacterium]|nr:proton-translocating transhydrogenase family protein [Bacteroidales bacterium]